MSEDINRYYSDDGHQRLVVPHIMNDLRNELHSYITHRVGCECVIYRGGLAHRSI